MGERRRQRDAAADLQAWTLAERADDQRNSSLRRWPEVVGAIRALAKSYNEGVNLEAITITEENDGETPSVTVSTGAGGEVLVIVLDGPELCVHAHAGSHAVPDRRYWVHLNRTSEATAAYLLWDWMARL
jgi:hypothetical protein